MEAPIDGGGSYDLELDPKWPGLDGGVPLEYSVSKMRAVARDMRAWLPGLQGPGASEGSPSGAVSSLQDNCQLSQVEIGKWEDAVAFSRTVGKESGGKEFLRLYTDFVKAYSLVIEAIEKHADVYAGTNHKNEGSREA